jgi:phospholipid transport system substrate-binding protein
LALFLHAGDRAQASPAFPEASMRRLLIPAGFLMGVLCMGPEAQAASPTEQLRGFFSAATRILDPQTDDGPEARLGAIRAIVKEIVDVPAAAQLSLGPNWNARTAAEREEFVRLFAELLERSLIGGIAGRIRLPDGIQVSYVGESVDGAVATVWTTLLSKRGLDLPFTYRMIERAGRWAICDVIIDGVSVAANYRAQFFRVLRSSSYQELVRQMRARVQEPLTAPVATAMGDDVVIVSVTPAMPPSDMIRKESPDARTWEALAPGPPGPRAFEADASARSDARFQLDLDVTLVARALPEAGALPANAGGGVVGEEPEPMAPRGDARSLPDALETTAARPAPASNGRSYWVQVGAFKSPEAARRLAALLAEPAPKGSGRSAVVVESWAADILLTRVRVGPFADRWEAAAKLREMEVRGYKPFIAAERD